MLHFLPTNRCFVYMPIRLERGELLSLNAASGFDVWADAQPLWITTEPESRDVFAAAGARNRITSSGHALVSADGAASIMVSGDAARATRIEVIRRDGERVAVYPPQEEKEREFAIEPAPQFMARLIPALAAVSRLIGSGG